MNTSQPKTTFDVTAKNPALATETQIDGVLVARVSKARAEAMGNTVPNANLVFVDDLTDPTTVSTTSLVTAKGFYYYDTAQSKWIPLNFSANDWHITGNAGTTAGTNYLGTNDDIPLIFKTDTQQAGFLSSTTLGNKNTAFGYTALKNANTTVTTTNNSAFGVEALNAYVQGPGSKAAFGSNTAIGSQAMKSAANASFSTALGSGALSAATVSWNNTAVGSGTLPALVPAADLSNGSNNTAVGGGSMPALTTGSGNTSLGLTSLQKATTGNANVAIGQLAGSNITTGSNNIVIGAYNIQVPDATKNGQLNIGDIITGTGGTASVYTAQTDTKKVGIAESGDKITEVLDVNGTTRVRSLPNNGATNAIYTKTDGTTSVAKDQTFTATKTVVADNNGVLGVVNGLPNFASASASREVSTATIDGDSTGSDGITLTSGCLSLMLDPNAPLSTYYVDLKAKIVSPCSGTSYSAITATGGDSVNLTYQDYHRENLNSTSYTSDGMGDRTMSNTPLVSGKIALIDLGQVYEYTYYANWNGTKNVYQIGLEMKRIQ